MSVTKTYRIENGKKVVRNGSSSHYQKKSAFGIGKTGFSGLETFTVTVAHEGGKVRLTVVSMSGIEGVIKQVTATERCPESAILKIAPKEVKSNQKNKRL
ncbi:hypothetical protein [Pedobacter sp.]